MRLLRRIGRGVLRWMRMRMFGWGRIGEDGGPIVVWMAGTFFDSLRDFR